MRVPRLVIMAWPGIGASALPGCAAQAPEELWNGHDFSGWKLVAEPVTAISSACMVTADGALAVVGKPIGYLTTSLPYENYRLHVEWRWHGPPGNGGRAIGDRLFSKL